MPVGFFLHHKMKNAAELEGLTAVVLEYRPLQRLRRILPTKEQAGLHPCNLEEVRHNGAEGARASLSSLAADGHRRTP